MPRKDVDFTQFSQAQMAAARLMADPEKRYTNKEIADLAGISERQFYRWKEDPDFLAMVNELNERVMDSFVTDVYRSLRKKVLGGDTKAIELAMKRMGVLIDRKEVSADIKTETTLALGAKSNDELLREIEERERKLLGESVETVEIVDDTFQPVETVGDAD